MNYRIWSEFAPQGDYVALRYCGLSAVGGGKREIITTFSRQSRSRLMRRLAMVKKDALPLFVTLTYPSEWCEDSKVYKEHVHAFFMVLKRYFPDYGAIWKLEFQKRGAPHYHMFLWGVPLDKAMELIPRLWYRIAGSEDENHLFWHMGLLRDGNNNCCDRVRSWKGVRSYASKYLCKNNNKDIAAGRFWGCVGLIPISKLITMKIDLEVALKFRRSFRRYSGMDSRRFGFWANGYHHDWLRFIDKEQTEYEERNIPEPFPKGWLKNYCMLKVK
jgi:hypothetical protein